MGSSNVDNIVFLITTSASYVLGIRKEWCRGMKYLVIWCAVLQGKDNCFREAVMACTLSPLLLKGFLLLYLSYVLFICLHICLHLCLILSVCLCVCAVVSVCLYLHVCLRMFLYVCMNVLSLYLSVCECIVYVFLSICLCLFVSLSA